MAQPPRQSVKPSPGTHPRTVAWSRARTTRGVTMSSRNEYPPHKHWSGWPDDPAESKSENVCPGGFLYPLYLNLSRNRVYLVPPDEGDLPITEVLD